MFYVKLRKSYMGHYRQCYYGTLVDWGFKLNDYDKCITNKIINGKQCTIIWHVNEEQSWSI